MTNSEARIGAIDNASWKHLRQRFWLRFRTAWNEGAAIFIASAVTLVLASLLLRSYFDMTQASEVALRDDFIDTVGTEHEPRDDLRFPGVVAAVLARTNRDGKTPICDPVTDPDCWAGHTTLD